MKKLESNLKLYVQPETEVLDMKLQTSLLGSSGATCMTYSCGAGDEDPECDGCFPEDE